MRYAWSRRGLAVWVAALGVIVTVTTTALMFHRDRTLERTRFGLLSTERISAIRAEIDQPMHVLSMFSSTNHSDWINDPRRFESFATSVLERFPQVQSLAFVAPQFVPAVPDQSELITASATEAASTANRKPPRTGSLEVVRFVGRTAEQDVPVNALSRVRSLGLEAHTSQNAFLCSASPATVSQQRENRSKQVVICRPIQFDEETNYTSRFDQFVSELYYEGSVQQGWILLEMDLDVALDQALDRLSETPIQFELFSSTPLSGDLNRAVNQESDLARGRDRVKQSFSIAGHPWTLVAATDRGSLGDKQSESLWLMLIAGLFASGSLAAYVASIVGRASRIQTKVEERTRELNEANRMLQDENANRRKAEERANDHANALEITNQDLLIIREDMAKTLVELEHRNEELDEFNFVASHDLQEPVRKLISFSKLLKQDLGDALSEEAAQDLHYIVESAQRMKQLIHDLLAFSKAGRSELQNEPVNVDECVQVAIDSLMLQIEEREAVIDVRDLPTIHGDMLLLTQLFQNLISNAIKFCTKNSPRIEISSMRSGDAHIICVQDNGIGINPHYIDRIFQPFQRLHGRSKYEGNGIGLAICKKTVARHQGRIWVESEPGKGSRFYIALPVDNKTKSTKKRTLSESMAVT